MTSSNNIIPKNVYLKLVFKSLIVLTIVILVDFIIGGVLKIYYFKQSSGLDYRTTYSMEKTKADLLIFGSSTANHDYVPNVFEHRLNSSCRIVGREGLPIFYHYAVLKSILKRYSPKTIILDFEEEEFSKSQDSYDRLACLLPYYKSHPEIDTIVDMKSPFEKYKLVSSIYPYNSLLFSIFAGNTQFNKTRQEDINGFVPLKECWNYPISNDTSFLEKPIDVNKVKIYEAFIQECVKANIQLYIVSSPLFVTPDYYNKTVALGEKIAAKYNVRFFDFSQDKSILNNPALFADIHHLNENGAMVYSHKIADALVAQKSSTMDMRKTAKLDCSGY